jgi:glycosyltransferase involved in cell wall biosynthesis
VPSQRNQHQSSPDSVLNMIMSEKPRKVLLAVPYFPPHKGGTELFTFNIAKQLSGSFGWHVVVLTTTDARSEKIERVSERLTIYRLPYWRKVSNSPVSLSWFWRIRKIVKTERPDLINAHSPVPGLGDIASLVAGRLPVIVNYHAGSMRKGQRLADLMIWVYEHVALKASLGKARKIIASSDFVRDGILSPFAYKAITITPGVDAEQFYPAKSAADRPHLLFVGSLNSSEKHKNLRGLLVACKELRFAIPELELTVVGDGDDRAYYEELAESMGLGDRTTFMGYLDRGALADVYRSAAVFAMPSTNDSFPLVITEAMASGLPIVSTRVGGIPTLVDDGVDGLLVDPTSSDELVKALRAVLQDRMLAADMGTAGRAKAVHKLTWRTRGEMTDRVFRDVLGG